MNNLRLIAGSGRSGTTWVLDAMAEANKLRPVFEPLHPDSSEIAQRYGYACMTRDTAATDLQAFFAALADGSARSVWTSYRINPRRLRPAPRHLRSLRELKSLARKWFLLTQRYRTFRQRERRRGTLVKCIRANLLLDWLTSHADASVVLLMRHPCAVVESQLRFREVWDPYQLLERYQRDEALADGPMRERMGVLNCELNRPQALTAIWCIENLVPAMQAMANQYQVVFYEELLENPEAEWRRVAAGLGLQDIPDSELLRKPSQQASVRLLKNVADAGTYTQTQPGWRARLPAEQVEQIRGILNSFGVGFYSTTENRPDTDTFARDFLSGNGGKKAQPETPGATA